MIGFLLLMIVPYSEVAHDHVSIIEHNHFYDEQGRHVFTQNIFWRWNKYESRFDVIDFRLVKNGERPVSKTLIWMDGGTLRKVHANNVQESWTQVDPELENRLVLPKEKRQELSPVQRIRRAKELCK